MVVVSDHWRYLADWRNSFHLDAIAGRIPMPLQILWCARCSTAFTFTGARVERTQGGKLTVRHQDCGALNELAPNGTSEDGDELWKVVGEARPVH
jgi:hypothetical protein